MKRQLGKYSLYYVLVIFSCITVIWFIFLRGTKLEQQKIPPGTEITGTEKFSLQNVWLDLTHNATHDFSRLLMQIIVIIAISRIFAYFFNKIRQPAVIGEILAGIILGPSLLGYFFPQISGVLFPPESLPNLKFLSQIGLVLFMFIIGMELDLSVLRKKAHSAVVVSHTSIAINFALGMALAYYLYMEFAGSGVDFLSFGLFIGITMSVTAFPVLARILQERGWSKTPLGSLVITCAASDDITAWCILALLITFVKAGVATGAIFTVLLALVYLALMIFVIRPFLDKLGKIYVSRENLNRNVLGFIFIMLLFSAFATEAIGIHALFGAFVAGVVMPRNMNFKKVLSEKIEDISLVLLLPLFFVFTGLNTEIGLLNSPHHWIVAAIVIAVATGGKFIGAVSASRYTGHGWKESLIIGTLMNTRGLMELVILNIGLELKILSKEIFAILVLMAIFTTFMAGPVLEFIEFISRKIKRQGKGFESSHPFYRVLLSFGPPRMGSTLLKLVEKIIFREKNIAVVSALHMTADPEISPKEALIFEKEGFQPIKKSATDLDIRLDCIYKLTDDIDNEIMKTCAQGNYDMLVLGGARSLFTENILGGRVGAILNNVSCDVGILMDKGINDLSRVLVFYTGRGDTILARMLERFTEDPTVKISVVNVTGRSEELPLPNHNNIKLEMHRKMDKDFLDRFDLVMMEYAYWLDLGSVKTHWLNYCPSVFILKEGVSFNPILPVNEILKQKGTEPALEK